MKKILALVLSFAMLLGCVAMADEAWNISATVGGVPYVDANFVIATDDDGCTQLSLAGSVGEVVLNYFAQLGENSLVLAADDGEAVEITKEAALKAAEDLLAIYGVNDVTEVAEVETVAADPDAVAAVEAVFAYLQSEAFAADMETLTNVLASEVNRFAQLSMENGIVAIDEAGNLTIAANVDVLKALVVGYLSTLDSQTIATLASTTAWNMLGLSADGSEEIAAIAAVAEYIAAIDTSVLTAELYLNVNADGSAILSLEGAYGEETVSLMANYAEGNLFVVYSENDETLSFNYTVSETGIVETMTYTVGGVVAASFDGYVDYVNMSLNASIAIGEQTASVAGNVDTEASIATVVITVGEDVITYKIYPIENGWALDAFEGEEALGSMLLTKTETGLNFSLVSADVVMVSADLAVEWVDETSEFYYESCNKDALAVALIGGDVSVSLYNGAYLTRTETINDDLSVTTKYSIGIPQVVDYETYETAILPIDVALTQSAIEEVPAHVSGTAMTAEELEATFMQIIEMLTSSYGVETTEEVVY